MNELIKIEKPRLPEKWNYKISVQKVKTAIYKWKNLTTEIIQELLIAREILSLKPSGQPRSTVGTFVPTDKNWTTYCQDIGSSRRVINRWLQRWFKPQLEYKEPSALPSGQFPVIYADPPWQFRNIGFEQSAEQHYPTMSVEEICELKIPSADNSVLFLWVVNTHLREGLAVCDAWGFKYQTNLVWIKNKGPSIGWFIIPRHELLFIATKGEGMHPKEKFKSWFEAGVTKHSKKPEIVYEMIEKMYEGPYLELFARQKRFNWTSWGNEL